LVASNGVLEGRKARLNLKKPCEILAKRTELESGSAGRIRTYNPPVNSRTLYR
jgi:hypothetical protein